MNNEEKFALIGIRNTLKHGLSMARRGKTYNALSLIDECINDLETVINHVDGILKSERTEDEGTDK